MSVELIDAPPSFPAIDPLDGLLELYRKHGFDAGYHQALRDQLEGLVPQAEAFLNSRDSASAERRFLYAFIARLENALTQRSPLTSHGFEGGAGI